MSKNGEASKVRRPRYWLIVKHKIGRMDVLTVDLASGEKALAAFSFDEEAELFLRYELSGTDWQVREIMSGELISVLYGPCAGVGKVALDPFPRNVSEDMVDLVSLRRDDFARILADK